MGALAPTRIPPEQRAAYVKAAADLVPLLRENAIETESSGWIADSNLAGIEDAGFLAFNVPESFGGVTVDQQTLLGVLEELGRGCGSTAWVMAIYIGDNGILRYFPEQAQAEVFAGGPARVCGAVTVGGTLAPVEGGYTLNGKWGFQSGSPGAGWSMLLARIAEADGYESPAVPVLALAPMQELELVIDWDVSGMAGTGSNSVVAHDAFVPAHRVVPVSAIPADLQITGMPVMIGMARGAIELFVESLPGKSLAFSRYQNKQEAWPTHLLVGEAQLRVDTASLILADVAELVQSHGESGTPLTKLEQVRLRAYKAHVTRLAREAVELVNSQAGASSIYRHLPIQRIFRDIEAISLHGLNNMPVFASEYGRILVGLDD